MEQLQSFNIDASNVRNQKVKIYIILLPFPLIK